MPRNQFSPPLKGRELVGIGDIPTLKAIYHLGDFRYQVLAPNGWVSKIRTCERYDTIEWLEGQMHAGNTVVVEVPKKPV